MDDRVWGFVLIAIGVAMIALHPWPERIDSWLTGLPNDVLTVVLVLVGIMTVSVAFGARPATKALLLMWIVLP